MKKYLLIILVLAACAKEKQPKQLSVISGVYGDGNTIDVNQYAKAHEYDTSYRIDIQKYTFLEGKGTAHHYGIYRRGRLVKLILMFESMKYSQDYTNNQDLWFIRKATDETFKNRLRYCEKVISEDRKRSPILN